MLSGSSVPLATSSTRISENSAPPEVRPRATSRPSTEGAKLLIVVWTPAPDAGPLGWVYFAQDAHAPGIWNLWWIGVRPANHGAGIGTALLRCVEGAVDAAAGRLLVIETSALPALAGTRMFYRQRGYRECGRVPDFYAPGDDKVIFAKRIEAAAAPTDA